MNYSVESFNKWLYPDDIIGDSPVLSARVKTARAGYGSFQILTNGLNVGDSISVCIKGVPKNVSVEVYRELDVYVSHNTGVVGFWEDDYEIAKEYTTRKAPFRVFDALEPILDVRSVKNSTEAFYVAVKATKDAEPNVCVMSVEFTIGDNKIVIPVETEVVEAIVPKETLYITNWYRVHQMAEAHGYEMFSEEHWKMIKVYAEAMRRTRQTTFWVTWNLVEKSKDEFGNYTFDFSNAKRFIELFLSLGFTQIEGGPVFRRAHWGDTDFLIDDIPVLSEEGYACASALLKEWYKFLKENNWLDITVQHVADEPHENCSLQYRILSGIVRKFMPGIRIIEAVDCPDLAGAVDIWVPKNNKYIEHNDIYEWYRKNGDEIWYYTCCMPGGHFANRLLDMPLIRTRMLHWGNYKYNLTGYLHWGFNCCDPKGNSLEETCGGKNFPAGDMNLVYPCGDRVLLSLRLEQMRSGVEDYELLKILAQKDEKTANALCDECFKAFDDCDCPADKFDGIRDKLLKKVSENF